MKTVKYLYVYILKCSDSTYYTGITNNPERRLIQNQRGLKKDSYTSSRLPVELVYCELFTDFNLAIECEKKIKKWSRAKKAALIKQNWDKLKESSQCRNETTYKNTYRYIKS
jgi:putative endonuclease